MRRAKGCRARAREQEHELRNSVHHGTAADPRTAEICFFFVIGRVRIVSENPTQGTTRRGMEGVGPETCPGHVSLLVESLAAHARWCEAPRRAGCFSAPRTARMSQTRANQARSLVLYAGR